MEVVSSQMNIQYSSNSNNTLGRDALPISQEETDSDSGHYDPSEDEITGVHDHESENIWI